MCGLVGMAGNIGLVEKKIFRDLLVFDTVRGFDSTGVALVKSYVSPVDLNPKPVIVDKELGAPQNIWEDGKSTIFDAKGHFDGYPKAVIGHNRAATVGKVTAENAHPFSIGKITGAHNGSLRNWTELAGADTFDVDSMALFNNINIKGIEHTWKSFTGAAALTYWDEGDKTLNLIRNDERPLYIAYDITGKILYWASEAWMISIATSRNGVKLQKGEDGYNLITQLEVDTLYTFDAKPTSCDLLTKTKLEKKLPSMDTGAFTTHIGFKSGTNGSTTPVHNIYTNNKDWKNFTEKSKIPYRTLELMDMRLIERKVGSIGPVQYVFRFTLTKDKVFFGHFDVVPLTNKEYNNLSTIVSNIKKGGEYSMSLRGCPRLDSSTKNTSAPRYVGPQSMLNLRQEGNVLRLGAVKKDMGVTNTPPHPYKDYANKAINTIEMAFLLKQAGNCCSYCNSSLFIKDAKGIEWAGKDQPICEECVTNWGGNLNKMFGV
jgi:hypothetical protein